MILSSPIIDKGQRPAVILIGRSEAGFRRFRNTAHEKITVARTGVRGGRGYFDVRGVPIVTDGRSTTRPQGGSLSLTASEVSTTRDRKIRA